MAMDELLNEHEQGERVRSWLQKNAGSLIGGVAVGIAIIWGWQWWGNRQHGQQMHDAEQYETLVSDANNDPAKLSAGLGKLSAGSMYGALARMQLAKAQVDAGKPQDALATLRAIQAGDSGLADVIDVRIGRLLVETNKPADAIALLGKATSPGALEVLGDAQAKQGQTQTAQATYKRALTTLEVGSPERMIVELKLADVGGAP
ncbi:MAG: tetratricopeptide repeat protein [Xanthomonadales bacterium]|nr:tetratricopeptide repeat protein [Xanthomonadales bacterium]